MTLDQRISQAVHHVADRVAVPDVDLEAVRAQVSAKQRRTVSLVLSAAVLAVLAATGLLAGRVNSPPVPAGLAQPSPGTFSGAVWYDDAGLHHGDQVEATPFELFQARGEDLSVLALVRDGALYVNPGNGDVWLHPWNGEPRVVGHNSATGPGGDSAGVVAAWFEGNELVVYDTARGVEISRTPQSPVLGDAFREYVGGYEHVVGNGFMRVSAEEVVWRSAVGVHRLDVTAGRSSLLWQGPRTADPRLEDVHNTTTVWGDYGTGSLSVQVEGRERLALPDLEPMGRLNGDGTFLVSAMDPEGSPGAAFVDLDTGETWPVVGEHWNAWIAWSYGDVAVLRVERGTAGPDLGLFACDASARECSQLESGSSILLPSSS